MSLNFFKLTSALKLTAGVGINIALISYAMNQAKRHHTFFSNLPEKEQKNIYNNCVLQKYGSCGDLYSGFAERMLTLDSKAHAQDLPRAPYKSQKKS